MIFIKGRLLFFSFSVDSAIFYHFGGTEVKPVLFPEGDVQQELVGVWEGGDDDDDARLS